GVVPVHRSHVLDAEVFEHRLWGDGVLEALFDRVQGFVQRPAHHGGAFQGLLDRVQQLLVARGQPQGGQVVRQPTDGGGVGTTVVVDHDHHRIAGGGD